LLRLSHLLGSMVGHGHGCSSRPRVCLSFTTLHDLQRLAPHTHAQQRATRLKLRARLFAHTRTLPARCPRHLHRRTQHCLPRTLRRTTTHATTHRAPLARQRRTACVALNAGFLATHLSLVRRRHLVPVATVGEFDAPASPFSAALGFTLAPFTTTPLLRALPALTPAAPPSLRSLLGIPKISYSPSWVAVWTTLAETS